MKMRMILVSVSAVLIGLGAVAAQATDAFRLERTESGFVRMDTETGAMSICEEREGQLVCRMAADESRAAAEHAEGLERRIDRLEQRITALERAPEAEAATKPSDAVEFEEGLDRMERFFRRFMGIVREFENDTPGPTPERT